MTMKTFVTGEILTAADLNVYGVNTIAAIKSAGESVTSSTTLQNDDELVLALAANSSYWVEGILSTDGAAAGDIRIGFTGPSGATLLVEMWGPTLGAVGGGDVQHYLFEDFSGGQTFGTIAAFDHRGIIFKGTVKIAGTAGNLQLQWAQGASSATATRVLGMSTMWARRIS